MTPYLVAAALVAGLLVTVLVIVARARRPRRATKRVREPSAFVILEGNAWEVCTVDDVREPWNRFTTEPVRGFCGVTAGRHRVRTTTPAGEATLDFVVYPGEVLAWRLDRDRARWEPHDLEAEILSSLESAPASTPSLATSARPKLPGWLVHLRTTVRLASSRGSGPAARVADDGIERVQKRLTMLVARMDDAAVDALDDALVDARGLGEALVGLALTSGDLRMLVAPIRDAASRLAARGDTERAMGVVGLGLALLPGAPELMVVAGCTLAARGEMDEAMRALNAALERDRCLDAEDVARAMRVRMDLRSRLGRSVRA